MSAVELILNEIENEIQESKPIRSEGICGQLSNIFIFLSIAPSCSKSPHSMVFVSYETLGFHKK